jgi:hypothetical protein
VPEETNLTTQTNSPLTWVIRLPQTNHSHTASFLSFSIFGLKLQMEGLKKLMPLLKHFIYILKTFPSFWLI